MFDRLIITSTDFCETQTIFSSDGEFNKLVYSGPQDYDEVILQYDLPILPQDVYCDILVRAVLINLKDLEFKFAAELMSISKQVCKEVYKRIFPENYKNIYLYGRQFDLVVGVYKIAIRLQYIFFLIEQTLIVHTYDTPPQGSDYIYFIKAALHSKASDNFMPWEVLGQIMTKAKDKSLMKLVGRPEARFIRHQRRLMDVAVIEGSTRFGITTPTYLKTPMIVFGFVDERSKLKTTRNHIEKEVNWKRFNDLWRMIIGDHVGIYYLVRNNNQVPFNHIFDGDFSLLVEGV